MRISDWSSDVCSSDLQQVVAGVGGVLGGIDEELGLEALADEAALHVHHADKDGIDAAVGDSLLQLRKAQMTRHGKRAPSSGLAGTAAPFVGAGTGRPPSRTGKVPHNNRLPGVGRGSIESAGSGGGGKIGSAPV